jgi:hypothetical protein
MRVVVAKSLFASSTQSLHRRLPELLTARTCGPEIWIADGGSDFGLRVAADALYANNSNLLYPRCHDHCGTASGRLSLLSLFRQLLLHMYAQTSKCASNVCDFGYNHCPSEKSTRAVTVQG